MVFNWIGIVFISFVLIIIVSISSVAVVTSTAHIPESFDECATGSNGILLAIDDSFIASSQNEQEYLREYINSLVQVCQYTMKTSSLSIPAFWKKGIWIDHERYSHWFERSDVYSFANPQYKVPQTYDECSSLHETYETNRECSIKVLQQFESTIAYQPESPFISIKPISWFPPFLEGQEFVEISYYSVEYYPCNADYSCFNPVHVCSSFKNSCSALCNSDSDCPAGMNCSSTLGKLTGSLINNCVLN